MITTRTTTARWLAGAGALALGAIAALPAAAQQQQPAAEEEAEDEDLIIVTGTSIRGVSAVGANAVSLSREDLVQAGRTSPVDALRETPQIQGLGFDDTPRFTNSGNVQRGRALNLRGIGNNATLLLIDGNRVSPTGNVFSFTEADQLPVAAIERIEVIAEGASAIYGSDAIAGVVNYITRKNFDGLEVTARGTHTDGYDQWGASAVFGQSWGSGGFVIAYDYDHRSEMTFSESPYLMQDLTPFGGPDNRLRGNTASFGTPGSLIVPRTSNNPTLPLAGRFDYYTPPAGTSGVGLTGANLIANQPALVDTALYTSYLPRTERHQISLTASQELGEMFEFSLLAFFNDRQSRQQSYILPGLVTIASSSPFYVTGVPGVAPGAPLTVGFSLFKDVGPGIRNMTNQQWQVAPSLRADLGSDWQGTVSANFSRNENCALCVDALSENIDLAAMRAAIASGQYNPLSTQAAPASVLSTFLIAAFDRSWSTLDEYNARFDGPLAQLPGGTLRAALGASYMHVTQERIARGQGARDGQAFASRNVKAVFGEVYIPLLGNDLTMPGVQSFVLNAALRGEDYSDVGSTWNPKFGFDWDVVDGVRLRGSWGTSFRAPNLLENNPAFFATIALATVNNAAGDPTIPVTNTAAGTTNIVRINGSNADLSPETAESYSLGVEFQPEGAPGLFVSLTYYNLEYRNQIVTLQGASAAFLANAFNRALYAPYIIAAPQPAGCVNGDPSTYNQAYRDLLQRQVTSAPNQSNFCSASAIFFARNTNSASITQDGLDVTVSYEFSTGGSDWRANLNFTKILNNTLTQVPGATPVDALDIINQPISLRGRAGLRWTHGAFTVSPSATYVGGYTNNIPVTVNGTVLPVAKIPAWTTFDLSVGVDFSDFGSWGEDLRLTLNVRNLFDKNPPLVLSANGNAFDSQAANPFGRIFSVQLSKTF